MSFYSTNTSEQTVEEQIEAATYALDKCDMIVQECAVAILRDKAEKIANEQRRLIASKSPKLASLIKVGGLSAYSDSSRSWKLTIGYDSKAIEEGFEGLIMEFGRPGKRSGGVYQKGKHKGKPIGKVEPIPHIRRGFDNVIGEVVEELADELFDLIDESLDW